MKKKNFITLVLATIGGILFALGMCMTLLPEWNCFTQGIVIGSIGALVLLLMLIVRCKMEGKSIIVKLNGKTIGIIILSVIGALILGVGMCMTMVWEGLMIPGIIVGIIGIVMLLFLIPVCKGIKD